MSQEIHPPEILTERRITTLETQMTEVLRMFQDIRLTQAQLLTEVTKRQANDAGLANQIEDLKKDVAAIKQQITSLDTIAFFVKNPKLALFAVVGFAFFFISDFREAIVHVLQSLISEK